MTTEDDNKSSIDKVRGGVELLSQIMRAAGDNKHVKAAGNELGKTAVTITKLLNNVISPLDTINFGFDKAREYFRERFEKDITDKIQVIPQECLVEPKAYIAGPILQGLAFSHKEEELKEMFLNLLASSMDSRTTDKAHPAFVEIIRQLNSKEAELLGDILSTGLPSIPITQLRDIESIKSYTTVQTYVLNITDEKTGEPICMPEVSSMIDNLIRLGIVRVEFGLEVGGIPNAYNWADNRPEIELVRQMNKHKTMNIQSIKGMLSITSLGWNFAESVGIYERYTQTRERWSELLEEHQKENS